MQDAPSGKRGNALTCTFSHFIKSAAMNIRNPSKPSLPTVRDHCPTPVTRRNFLRGAFCAAAAPLLIPSSVFGANGTVAPSKKVTVALIGRGAMGSGHLHRLAYDPGFQLLAVCDPDKIRR